MAATALAASEQRRHVVKQVPHARLYSDGTILIMDVRASYLHAFTPYQGGDDDSKSKFGVVGMMPKKREYFAAKDMIRDVINGLIRENKQKWFFLGIFTVGLFVLGGFAGRIFTGALSNAKRRGAACLLVSMSCVCWSIEVAAQELGQRKYFGWLEIDPATVGKPSKVRWRLAGEENVEGRAVLLSLTIMHLEKGKTVFSVERLPVEGKFAMNFQFTDGAEYRVGETGMFVARGRSLYGTISGVTIAEAKLNTSSGPVNALVEFLPRRKKEGITAAYPFRFIALGDQDYERLSATLQVMRKQGLGEGTV